jgi:dihydroorotate dehydrogenase (NAD+) catalytic subunit
MYRPDSMHASTSVGSLVLAPPLVNGSGVVDAVSSDEGWNLPAGVLSKLGAFTTKTITTLPRAGNPQPWAEAIDDATLVNAAGLPNPGIVAAMRDWAYLPGELGIPVIVSIGGDAGLLPELAAQVEAAGWAAAIELNLSCPNVAGGLVAGDPCAVADVVARVRASTNLPLFAKLTPACNAPALVARAAVTAGADALTCGNTMPIRAIDHTGAPLLGAGPNGGMSGRALHPIALRLVAEVAAAVDVPIVGLGGVDGLDAARRMSDVGATIIGVGTGAILDPSLVERLAAMADPAATSTLG